MNCPSRTDDTLLHSDWNQNPPSLSPDLTTRQDLNGRSNDRECKGIDRLTGLSKSSLDATGDPPPRVLDPDNSLTPRLGVSLTKSGPPIYRAAIDHGGRESYSNYLSYQTFRDWAVWLASVFVASLFVPYVNWRSFNLPELTLSKQNFNEKPLRTPSKRKTTCAQGGVSGSEYNLPLHIAALFIILSVSTLACAFPILAVRFPRLRIPTNFLFFVSHFGTGVLIATAFVHLLPTAFTMLGDPCLPDFWTTDYPAMPGAIALGGIFLVTVIEMVFSPARRMCCGSKQATDRESVSESPKSPPEVVVHRSSGCSTEQCSPSIRAAPLGHIRDLGPLMGRSSSMSRAISQMEEDPDRIHRIESTPQDVQSCPEKLAESVKSDGEFDDSFTVSIQQKQRKDLMQVVLLEMGILFHSVFIGMSLSVSVGSEFVVLLIAIVFHQSFEGLALGSRIASLNWPDKAIQPWLMSLAYGCTTPIGQAIGLATHTLYSPDSEVGLVLVGTMNAISSGLLIFASLVELMAEDFLSDESWRVLRGKRRVYACILVFLGAFFMSLVGAWA